jgi:hypothetical protein
MALITKDVIKRHGGAGVTEVTFSSGVQGYVFGVDDLAHDVLGANIKDATVSHGVYIFESPVDVEYIGPPRCVGAPVCRP